MGASAARETKELKRRREMFILRVCPSAPAIGDGKMTILVEISNEQDECPDGEVWAHSKSLRQLLLREPGELLPAQRALA